MLLERIESAGLAQYSYIVGDGSTAIVIDPRRDCDIYQELARGAGMRITTILETHRHEDFAVGSVELAARTGAEIWHADAQLPYHYGQAATEGQIWQAGSLKLEALLTPGHTEGSLSYLLRDASGAPWIVFTGDVLFAGEVGRVDFLGMDRASGMASQLYDAIFGKLLPLGDGVLVGPGHGAGSPCGSAIADRAWTSLGLERALNPRLQHIEREAFIAGVVRQLPKPPYFSTIEHLNLEGAPILSGVPLPPLLSVADFAAQATTALVVDVRSEFAYSTAHVPGAQFLAADRLAVFGGWFMPVDRPLLLVADDNSPTEVMRILIRLGYDNVRGVLAGGMTSWNVWGHPVETLPVVTAQALRRRLAEGEPAWLLDVRSEEELAHGRIEGAHLLPIRQLQGRESEVPRDIPVYVFCGSGTRATIAASWLQRQGWHNLHIVLGGFWAWNES